MIEWEETDTGLRAFDRTKTEISVGAPDWQSGGRGCDIERPIDETAAGYASELRFPPNLVTIIDVESDERHHHGSDTELLELPEGEYLANIHGNVKTYLRFSGPATIRKTSDFDALIVSFHDRIPVTLGFRSHHEIPVDTITVPPTTEGLATAISYASSSHKVTGADRSFPTLRGHPPRFEVGNELRIPEPVRKTKKDAGIEMRVPDDFGTLFVTAPLAYYLQADVIVENRPTPVLRAPSVNFTYTFSPLPDYQHEVAEMLRQVFFIDCLVRNAGPYHWNLAEMSLLDELELDSETIYKSTPAEQLVAYDLCEFGRIDDELPDWHLSMYVEPSVENISTLPYLLANLSLIYLPNSSNLNRNELLDASLGDFYRNAPSEVNESSELNVTQRATAGGGSYRAMRAEEVTSVERINPTLHRGRVHGWLAEGVPIDVFKADPSAYENRFAYLDRDSDDIEVELVLNDEEMGDEHEDAADIYLDRAEDLPIEVTIHENLTRDELAELLETPCDYVHYIGHCEEDGLRCPDGNLSVEDIEESKVQTFFLNACGSYYEGMELIKKGSVAGAVTFNKVLNKQAAKVGVSFARLLINGFSIQDALQLARRRIMMNKDYAVVGDGTHILTQSDNCMPFLGNVERLGEKFRITFNSLSVSMIGGIYQPYIENNNESNLHENESSFVLTANELRSFLKRAEMPILYDAELYWSEESQLLDQITQY
ncbi:hypothetical protein SAMN05421858_1920 [Haladaptatus litoreus]|uniref:CHAT domain-containing protein n=1 Tax=Haladaptatus litoreus TaxID=553468 RepID=A0A1N6Z8H9_9EURY|nr:hypothetical protein [Haladaptatus litoreus]SIR23134.1 hypothetical protein SAMN05421858_1920 [Haladaptatus litoreus]